MQSWRNRSAVSLGFMGAVLLLLPVLAVLQYRWIGQVSQAERERMQANLLKITTRFSEDFDHELTDELMNLSVSFQRAHEIAPEDLSEEFARQYAKWHMTSQYPNLLKRICLIDSTQKGDHALSCFDSREGRFKRMDWPAELASLRERLTRFGSGRMPFRGPGDEDRAVVLSPLFPAFNRKSIEQHDAPRPFPRIARWTLAQFNMEFIEKELLPSLIRRHFGQAEGLDYEVSVVSRSDQHAVLYRSDPNRPLSFPLKGDAVVNFFDQRPERFVKFGGEKAGGRGMSIRVMGGPGEPGGKSRDRAGQNRAVMARPDTERIVERIPLGPDRGRWQLVANHRSGSMESVVDTARRRNLAVSFVILLFLGASIVMILVSTRRAQRLLRLQMEFVAGISHEFCTPLAVICSAGANLADGVVTKDPKTQHYGNLIRKEGQRLSELVEQVLGFSQAESGWTHYDLQPIDVQDVIMHSAAACDAAIKQADCELELHIEPNLPPIMADPSALERCMRNLIGNAVKYGRKNGWIGIFVDRGENEGGAQLRIRVMDKGPGIKSADLPHIFEPFYRSKDAVEARVHGAGLGLSLVKRIIEEHSGKINVESTPGSGACFTLLVPIANEAAGSPVISSPAVS
jgi:signal transduction histidine kinase